MRHFSRVLGAIALLLSTASLRAASISDMGTAPSFTWDTTLTAIGGGAFNWIAIKFTVPVAGKLQSIEVPLQYGSGPNQMTFSIITGATAPTGGTLETLTATNIPTGFAITLITLPSITHPTLNPGTTYWLLQKQTSNSTAMNWANNNQGVIGYSTTFNGTTWFAETGSSFKTPAYSIDFTPVPEPSTWAMAIGALALIRRRAYFKPN